MTEFSLGSGGDLLSRAVSSQVPSALKGLTAVFGMGTGGSPSPLPPEVFEGFASDFHPTPRTLKTAQRKFFTSMYRQLPSRSFFVSVIENQTLDRLVSPSSMPYDTSTGDLSPSSLLGVSHACALGHFFLRLASRLDAFSVYPSRTSLPCYAVGTTTVAPVVRPLRSSRTRSSSSHVSYAHDG